MGRWKRGVVLVLLPTVLQLLVVTASTAEIHCYCNTDECVSRGHKCRSQLGHCFSKMRFDPQPEDEDNSIHGCAESLPTDERTSCSRGDSITRRANGDADSLPILMCCTANLCNYIDKVDPPNIAIDVYTNNDSDTDPRYNKNHVAGAYVPPGGGEEYSAYPDLWFRVAVIAVPVAGALILVVLVLTALRMLRHDSRRLLKRDESMAKAQLYVADHFHPHGHSSVLYTEHLPQSACGTPCVEKGYDHIGYVQQNYPQDGSPNAHNSTDNTCVFETEAAGNPPRHTRHCDGMSTTSEYCLCSVQQDTCSDSESSIYQTQRASLYKIVPVKPGTCCHCGNDIKASWQSAKRTSKLGPHYDIYCMGCALAVWRLGPEGVCYSVSDETNAKQTDSKRKPAVSQNESCLNQGKQLEEWSAKSSEHQSAISNGQSQNQVNSEPRDESCDATNTSCDQSYSEAGDEQCDQNTVHDQTTSHDQKNDESLDENCACHDQLLPNSES